MLIFLHIIQHSTYSLLCDISSLSAWSEPLVGRIHIHMQTAALRGDFVRDGPVFFKLAFTESFLGSCDKAE